MPQVHTGGLTPGMISSAGKIKRACSEVLNANTLNDIAAIVHTTTAITVTAIRLYSVAAATNGSLKMDVGINGSVNSIASAAEIGATVIEDVDTIAIGTAAVAAGKTIVAKVQTADGAAGEVQVLIEYTEIN